MTIQMTRLTGAPHGSPLAWGDDDAVLVRAAGDGDVPAQERLWRLAEPGREKPADPMLERCRRISHAMVAALQGMKETAPDDIAGLL